MVCEVFSYLLAKNACLALLGWRKSINLISVKGMYTKHTLEMLTAGCTCYSSTITCSPAVSPVYHYFLFFVGNANVKRKNVLVQLKTRSPFSCQSGSPV